MTSQAIAESFTLDQTPATFPVNLNQTPLTLDQTPITFPVNSDQTPLTLDQTSALFQSTLIITLDQTPATFPAMLHQTLFTLDQTTEHQTITLPILSTQQEISSSRSPNELTEHRRTVPVNKINSTGQYYFTKYSCILYHNSNVLQCKTQIAEKTTLHNLLFSYIL